MNHRANSVKNYRRRNRCRNEQIGAGIDNLAYQRLFWRPGNRDDADELIGSYSVVADITENYASIGDTEGACIGALRCRSVNAELRRIDSKYSAIEQSKYSVKHWRTTLIQNESVRTNRYIVRLWKYTES